MANMFYTLEEVAQLLGKSEEAIQEMADSGQIQQFRDRDKLMYKRDQIDALAGNSASASGSSLGPIPMMGEDTSSIDLAADTQVTPLEGDNRQATGVSVFDADEIDSADPMAQTQVTSPVIDDDDLSLESVGSGSGLLDLTRESDDTSLGAELLDEIYPGGGDGSDAKLDTAGSGVFDDSGLISGSGLLDTGTGSISGLENLTGTGDESAIDMGTDASAGGIPSPTGADTSMGADATIAAATADDDDVPPVAVVPSAGPAVPAGRVIYAENTYDPSGSGFGAGVLFGAMAALAIGFMIILAAVSGARSILVTQMAGMANGPLIWAGGLFVLSVILGVVGMVLGKALGKRTA